jgi:5-methylcytosine-specific restriction protein A
MNSYLFTWNPKFWPKENIDKLILQIKLTGNATDYWTIANRSMKPGDRAFLKQAGDDKKGIIGSGEIVSLPFLAPHYTDINKSAFRVWINFDTILDSTKQQILDTKILKETITSKQLWEPKGSGIIINPHAAEELEALWFDLTKSQFALNPTSPADMDFAEGRVTHINLKRYERNPQARRLCIDHYGTACSVCEFDFKLKYGEIGQDFIHIHHLKQISQTGRIQINPVRDLRPVCANCHAMLHKRAVPYTIEELKAIIKNHQQ